MANNLQDVARRLAAPFDAAAVRWKPMKVTGTRALAAANIDSGLSMSAWTKSSAWNAGRTITSAFLTAPSPAGSAAGSAGSG
jgi:hypothetical protein